MEKQAEDGILGQLQTDLIKAWRPFHSDVLECWRQLPNKAFFLILLAAWLALFHFLGNSTMGYYRSPSLLGWMHNAYNQQDATGASEEAHGNFIPLVVLGLFVWKRKQLLALPLKTWSPGLAIVGLGLLMHVVGYVVQQPRISIIGMFTGIYGLMGLAWGPAWLRTSFFPFFLFAACVPLGSLALPITFRLQSLVSRLVELVGNFVLGIGIVREGNLLMDSRGSFQYEVAAACSGIRSLIAISVIATIYAFVAFRGPGKRLLLIASAVPLAVLGNLFRMLFIVIAADMGGQTWGSKVHDSFVFSLVPYIPAIVGLLLLGRFLEGRERREAKGLSAESLDPKAEG